MAGGGASVGVPPFVALTGGVGAGKSTALAALERLGAATLSTDAVVHELYGSGPVRDTVVERFGPEIAPGGVVDRARLASVVFSNEADREWLERLLWPLVGERVASWREAAASPKPPPRALIVEVPLLFEAGHQAEYDATIAITAPEDLRAARAQARGHRAVDERVARQLSQAEKAQLATYVVENDGDVHALEGKLSAILAILER